VISLAKKEEIVYVQGVTEPVKLKRNHLGLKLLQYVRDEAHRFAQHYHHILRRKSQLEEDVKQGRRAPRAKKKKTEAPASSLEADLLRAAESDSTPTTPATPTSPVADAPADPSHPTHNP
jgi:hypothetical protein